MPLKFQIEFYRSGCGVVARKFKAKPKIPRRHKASVFADLRSNLEFNLARYFRLISDFSRWKERIEARA